MVFNNFKTNSDSLSGLWTDLKSRKQLKIKLKKSLNLNSEKDGEFRNQEIIQSESFDNKYFKLIISKDHDDDPTVLGLKILEKKTDKLLQQFDLECQFFSYHSIEIEDYNFDGIKDFSIYEGGSAGPDTFRIYFLYNPNTKKYFKSSISGSSLEFNPQIKKVFERNQCCGGRTVTTRVHKIVNNKMVLLEKHCYQWDDNKEKLVERKWANCN